MTILNLNDTNNNNCDETNCKFTFLPNSIPEKKITLRDVFFIKKAEAVVGGPFPTSGCFPKSGWYFAVGSSSDKIKICCNSKMKGCKVIDYETNCDLSVN